MTRVSPNAGNKRVVRYSVGALLGLLTAFASRGADAQNVAVSFSGNLASNQVDYFGLFGPPGGNLSGLPFSASIVYDPNDYTAGLYCHANVYYWSNTAGAMTQSLTINNITQKLITKQSDVCPLSAFSESDGFYIYNTDTSNKAVPEMQIQYPFSGQFSINNLPAPVAGDLVAFFVAQQLGGGYARLLADVGDLSIISPFLLGAKDLGNLDLATLLPNLTAPDSATALAADGTSAAIVLLQVPSYAPVTFTTNNGTTLVAYYPTFLKHPPDTTGSTSLKIPAKDLITIGSAIYAIALLQAPLAGVTPAYSTPITITAQQEGGKAQQAYLPLVPPPVLLVHGIWGVKSSLDYYYNYLTATGSPYSSATVPEVIRVGYTNDVAFDDKGPKSGPAVLTENIHNLRNELDSAGVVAGRIDIVAHSMGGLVARSFSRSAPYRSYHDRMQGAIHQIITIDTPEAGSGLANFLLNYKLPDGTLVPNATFENTDDNEAYVIWAAACGVAKTTTVQSCFGSMSPTPLTITGGAVASLVPGSSNLTQAPGPEIPNAIWNAISAVVPQTTGKGESALQVELQKLIDSIFTTSSSALSIATILGGDGGQDDAVVPATSQDAGGTPSSTIEFFGFGHIPAPSAAALNIIHQVFGGSKTDNSNVESSPAIASVIKCLLLQAGSSSCATSTTSTAASEGDSPTTTAKPFAKVAYRKADFDEDGFGLIAPSSAHLAKPFRLPFSPAEDRLGTTVMVYQRDELKHDATPQELKIEHDLTSNESYITVTPTLLGQVTYTIEAAYTDGHWLRRKFVVLVGMPTTPPSLFRADEDFHTTVLGLRDGENIGVIDPVAYFAAPGISQPIKVDLGGRVQCRVDQPDSNIVRLLPDCTFQAMNIGRAIIQVSFDGVVSNQEVVVKGAGEL